MIAVAIVTLCLVLSLAGCGTSNKSDDNLKDNIINGFNDWMQSFSKHALTKDRNLQGEKTEGDDTYVGSYTAEYEDKVVPGT